MRGRSSLRVKRRSASLPRRKAVLAMLLNHVVLEVLPRAVLSTAEVTRLP